MEIISTEKQEGVIYFLVKIISPNDKFVNIFVERVKGGGHDIPVPIMVDRRELYCLYKI